MTPEVAEAIEELKAAYPKAALEVREDPDGGAWVTIDPVFVGDQYAPTESFISFQITFHYPVSDVYPHFVRPDLRRVDGNPLGEATSPCKFGPEARDGIQISRKSNRLDPAIDTAALKLEKVLAWLRSR